MPDVHNALFHRHDRGLIVFVDADIKRGATDGNDCRRGYNPVGVGLPSPFLDVYFHPSNQNIQQIAPVSWILAEDHIRIRVNLEIASIGNLELREAVGTGDDDLLHLYGIADIQCPRLGIFEHRDLASQRDNLSSRLCREG